ncbi:MAG: glycosyltransferase family 1 protein [Patescibacteria group bacterium]
MRIGIDARFYGSVGKGLGRYTERLVHELEKIDTENEYFIFLCPENFDEYLPSNPHFTKVLTKSRWYSAAEQLWYPWQLYAKRLDLVHFPHFNVPVLYRRPLIVTLHDLILFHYPTEKATTKKSWWYWVKFHAYRFVLAEALRRAQTIITVSDFTKHDIETNYPSVKAKIVVTKEAAEQFCHFVGEASPHAILRPYILYVGNAYPHKNLEIFLHIAKQFPVYDFVLVGKEDFFYKRLKERVESKAIQNIVFTGYVSDRELGRLYRQAQAYVFPSLYEGFGLPPLEAMQYGTPVLASDRGSLPEILGEAALYFDPLKESELCTQLERITQDTLLRKSLQEKGYAQAATYSWPRMAEQTLREYKKTF